MSDLLLTTLSFSGGQQSSALLWMVIRGEIKPPEPFIVLNADPGMENSQTYAYVNRMKEICREKQITFVTVTGPNLYEDILNLKNTNKTRFDTPPYWTKNKETAKKGRLLQNCTKTYKIAPMDRAIRGFLETYHGISKKSSRIPGHVVKYIGFSADEEHRIKQPTQKYVRFEYPLIELGMTKQIVQNYFLTIGEVPPPRSVCNACFANSVSYFQEMKRDRPNDFSQAVAVDNAVRDWSQIGVRDEVYVLNTLKPLEELSPDKEVPDTEDWSCDSGYCFI